MGFRQLLLSRRNLSSSLLPRRSHSSSTPIAIPYHYHDIINDAHSGFPHGSVLEHGLTSWRRLCCSVSTSGDKLHSDLSIRDGDKNPDSYPSSGFVDRGDANLTKYSPVLDKWECKIGPKGLSAFSVRGYGKMVRTDSSIALLKRYSQAQTISCFHLWTPQLSASQHNVQHQNEDDENKQEKKLNKLETTPEECDEAVVGLSTAKAKAKKAQEIQTRDDGILKKIWSFYLGIWPALQAVASMSREDWAKKLNHWKEEIRDTFKHYWVGSKLLWADARISSRLLIKLAGGKNLTRRERSQLLRTTADIFRLVPFAVFIIVPFMEFLLPVFLKVFPNMLPSTFQDKMKEQEALKKKLNARIEYAKFLQDTVKQMAEEIKTTRSGELQRTAEDLDEFMNKVRRGESVSNDDILGFAKLFNDELTLDNISRPRIVSMCKYMGIQPYGTDSYLRHMLRSKLSWIKNDDRMIQMEGVDSLSESELRAACRERGMLGLLSVEEMKRQLRDWLALSLNYSVPSSLLILSRSFLVSGKVKPEEAVQATLSSLPDEVVESVGVTALPSEDALSERVRKLEYLQKQEELIKEETQREEVQQEKLQQDIGTIRLDEVIKGVGETVPQEPHIQQDVCKLSSALAVLAASSPVSKERTEFLRLVNKEIALYNEMIEKKGTDGATEARHAFQAAHKDVEHSAVGNKVSAALVERIDAMLHNLEKELDDADAVIGDQLKILDKDSDGKVTPEEVAAAAMFLKDSLGQQPVQELIRNLAKDQDGKILVEDILRLGTTLERESIEKEPESHAVN